MKAGFEVNGFNLHSSTGGSRSHSTYSLELHWKSDTVWDATWLYKTLISANKFKCYVSTLKDILPCTDLLAQPCRSVAAVRRSVLRVCSGHLPPVLWSRLEWGAQGPPCLLVDKTMGASVAASPDLCPLHP